ncbi:hypothetical protein [Microbacterium radiodurans]|uniref:hypothetical protein n=1 Tax=Microbacterium radiodurans TaxID=661398 RepID=UPI00168BAE41|nr:hypothetical protein [Microbacterium radiodurans]
MTRLRHLATRLPPAGAIAVIYVAARLTTTGFLLLAAQLSGPASRFGTRPSLGVLAMGWDAQWYWTIAYSGYPSTLPADAAGTVAENAWAFMPIYPWVSNTLGAVVGGYPVAAPVVSLIAGYFACLALAALLRSRLDRAATLWAVAFFAAGPLAAIFQIGYAESLFLLWLLLALLAVERRRWWWLYALVPLLAFTRPGVLAFSLFLALYGIWRFVRRRTDPLPPSQIVHIVVSGLLAAALGLLWPVITGIATGDPQAYLHTELAWRRSWIGDHGGFVPFDGAVRAAALWFELWGLPSWLGPAALVTVIVAVALVLIFSRHVRRLGVPTQLWSASYLLYLLAVFFPQSSTFRLLLPLAPLTGALAAPRSTPWRVSVLLAGLVAQAGWIVAMYAFGNTYWQVP